MSAYWLDKSWKYHNAGSHGKGDSFARRMRERIRQAELARKADAAREIEAAVKVRNIKTRREA